MGVGRGFLWVGCGHGGRQSRRALCGVRGTWRGTPGEAASLREAPPMEPFGVFDYKECL